MRGGWGLLTLWAVVLAVLALAAAPVLAAPTATPLVTIETDQPVGPGFMGLGVEWDPYDSFQPTIAQWAVAFQRLDFVHPGFLRVVEPATDYFAGYDASDNPTYRWSGKHVQQLLAILSYARSRAIPVVLGDWSNPMLHNDPRIPAGFLQQLHDSYGFTNIEYYNLINEPNGQASCPFRCWTNMVSTLSGEFASLGLNSWLKLVGPDNANSWDDTPAAQSLDRSSGLDSDNPIGGDSWVTDTLTAIPSLISAYDSHRYATVWGVENGVYGDQMRARREQINNLDSPLKPYFEGEVGLTARQVSPFSSPGAQPDLRTLRGLIDPSVTPRVSPFVDSQPHIEQFQYGVWMGDMMVQALDAGLSGASAWDLDDAMHVGGQYGPANLKQWGFWNSLGGQDGYPASDLNLRPWFYSWSVMSRSFPAGSQPLAVTRTGVPSVRVAAAKIAGAGGYNLSFAVANDSDAPHAVTLAVPSATKPVTLARYDYFVGDSPADYDGFAVPAATLPGVQLASGLTVQLPSRGMVVLSTLGAGSPVALGDGRVPLLDQLGDWQSLAGRSRGMKLDHANPARFDDDPSRAVPGPKAKPGQYVEYHAAQMTSFELKAYYPQKLGLEVDGSVDGRTWTPVELASTNPAPAVGGQSYLAEIQPAAALPAGTNWLKVMFANGQTELGQVSLQSGRPGPACLAPELARGTSSLGGIPLGATHRTVLGLFGAPTVRHQRMWRYCVTGGGEAAVVFARGHGVSLIASTGAGYRPRGIGPGSTVTSLRRRFPARSLRSMGRNVVVAGLRSGDAVFVAHAGKVQAVAIAAPALLANGGALKRAVRMARAGRLVRATASFEAGP